MSTRGRHSKQRKHRKLALVVTGVAALLMLGVVGAAAAVGAATDPNERLPRGLQIGGVELTDLDAEEARQRLYDKFERPLDQPLDLVVDGQVVESVTRRELGAGTNVDDVLADALSGFSDMSLFDRFWLRMTGEMPNKKWDIETTVAGDAGEKAVGSVAQKVDVAPVDASVSVAGSSIQVQPGVPGFALDRPRALEALAAAIRDPQAEVAELPGSAVEPARKEADFEDVIVVRVGANTLQHFESGRLVKTYDVATGLPSYPTPIGQFEITLMRHLPTWVNPAKAPGRWGENLPARIGPGPNNPLGTRAMNLNTPGIRIHGTTSEWSLGYNASHGCIRMRMSDVEELFDRVGVGTKVVIVRSGPSRLAPAQNTEPTVEDLVESDGAAAAPSPDEAPPPAPAPPAPSPIDRQPAPSSDPTPEPSPTPDDPPEQPQDDEPKNDEPEVGDDIRKKFNLD